ncbi:Ig-like domain-containing protein [Euzebyella saccharophila]|uniref:Ig-like domain-containing protein n=1 Tax=Euzebyella saccharophila TaxID=679664 RepID=A0ABV8JZ55_9FLAO|nr:Ig-like domain-containing protein [Euzebyella saccharophila]
MLSITFYKKILSKFIFVIFILHFSCSKDTDLLSSRLISDSLQEFGNELIIKNDIYYFQGSNEIVLNVLDNDIINDENNVKIITTTQPENGSVEINSDNTLTYSPNNEVESSQNVSSTADILEAENQSTTEENIEEDTFTYTVETTDENGQSTTKEGKVTIEFNKYHHELKAFPDAQGFGKFASGGRGGRIIEVTNLNNNGPGSLRAALEAEGPRNIVFRVSGTIECDSYLVIKNGNGNVTIAGQTAPGEGIAIKGAELRIQASNVIVRHIRIRPGDETSGSNEDALRVVAYKNTSVKDVIIDHCSISWGKDENIEIGGIGGTSSVQNVTIQNSIIGENINTKYGLLLWNRAKNISVYQNLFVHNKERNIRSSTCTSSFEMINNLIYGFKDATYPTYENQFDIIGNVYKSNPGLKANKTVIQLTASLNNCPDGNISQTEAYIKDNILDGESASYSSNIQPYIKSSKIFNSGIEPMKSSSVESYVLEDVGATKPSRDSSDRRVINNVINGDGGLLSSANSVGYPNLKSGEAYPDEDKDGMDDEWEIKVGLDPNNSSDANLDANQDGYTNLEVFFHYLATL